MERTTRYALLLSGAYVGATGLYIIVSSRFAASSALDVHELERLETIKGLTFVLTTGLLLFFGALWSLRRIERASQEMLRREQALVANERRITAGVLAASIAHDVNNVLTPVMVDLAALQEKREPREPIERLEAAIARITALNRRLMTASRSSVDLTPKRVEADGIVREAVTLLRPHQHVRDCQLELELAPIELETQPLFLQQIVGNLVLNAAEATGGKGRVRVELGRDGERVVLAVHDDGPGVPRARRAHLFEALETTKPEGNGLGLFSVGVCARTLGGDVDVGDSPLGGALFRVSLPLPPRAGASATPSP